MNGKRLKNENNYCFGLPNRERNNVSCIIKNGEKEIEFDGVEASIIINRQEEERMIHGDKVLIVVGGLPEHVKNDIYKIIFDYCKQDGENIIR